MKSLQKPGKAAPASASTFASNAMLYLSIVAGLPGTFFFAPYAVFALQYGVGSFFRTADESGVRIVELLLGLGGSLGILAFWLSTIGLMINTLSRTLAWACVFGLCGGLATAGYLLHGGGTSVVSAIFLGPISIAAGINVVLLLRRV